MDHLPTTHLVTINIPSELKFNKFLFDDTAIIFFT